MKRLSKSHSDSFAIYREKWGTMATLGLISVGIAAFGGFMIFLAGDKGASAPPFWFGWGLVILGAGILVTAIPYFRNMLREGHALEARVDLAGLTVAPALSSLLVQYPWAHVVGIDLIATLSLRDDEGRRRRYGCSAGPTRSARSSCSAAVPRVRPPKTEPASKRKRRARPRRVASDSSSLVSPGITPACETAPAGE